MPALTLHQGDNHREYEEHPVEVARRALREAALLEEAESTDNGDSWASLMRRAASSLPKRERILRTEA
jgi:hypothetical protein